MQLVVVGKTSTARYESTGDYWEHKTVYDAPGVSEFVSCHSELNSGKIFATGSKLPEFSGSVRICNSCKGGALRLRDVSGHGMNGVTHYVCTEHDYVGTEQYH